MLAVKNIHTYYGESYIIQGVSLNVAKGSVVAIMGRNGMGKTTLIRSIIGFTPPRRGQIIFKGSEITHMPTYKITRAGIGVVPQGRLIFTTLSVRENLQISSRQTPDGWDIEKIISLFPSLKARFHHMGDEISGGEQQMLATARALIHNPELLLMDEPSEGLAPLLIQEIIKTLLQLKDTGLSILLVEPNLSIVKKIADYVYVMSKGVIVHESNPVELLHNKEVQSKYLGM